MLDQVKAFHKAKKIKSKVDKHLEQISHRQERGNSSVILNGNKKVIEIIIDGESRRDIKDLFNSALKETDKKAEKEQEKIMKGQVGDIREMLGL